MNGIAIGKGTEKERKLETEKETEKGMELNQ